MISFDDLKTMRILYTLLMIIATPFYVLRLLLKSLQIPAYRKRILERFGYFKAPHTFDIWVHAVSLGEVNVAFLLIQALRARFPEKHIILTTTTPTGSARARTLFGDSLFHVYAPYDLPWVVRLFFRKTQPKLAIIMETELWPNLFKACAERQIPLFLANARRSLASQQRKLAIKPLLQATLSCVTQVLAQTTDDGARFIALGLPKEKLAVLGNIKYEISLPADLEQRALSLRSRWEKERLVWVAGSTHEGEEEIIIDAFKKIVEHLPDLLLVLVPRHPERSEKVRALAIQAGCKTELYTTWGDLSNHLDILIINTIGELMIFYKTADVAFVGGSLVPRGGHNFLEPAHLGVPVITGPHVFNFTEVHQMLTDASGILTVDTAAQLAEQVLLLLSNKEVAKALIQGANKVIQQNQGALGRHLEAIAPFCERG